MISSAKAPTYVVLAGEGAELPSAEYIRVVAQSSKPDGAVGTVEFALHTRGARFCKLLESLLDASDMEKCNATFDSLPPVTIPQATREGCECVLTYLDLIQTRVPSLLSKPLRAPLEELVQPWELSFILDQCFPLKPKPEFKGTMSFMRTLAKAGAESMNVILEVAMISDFLLIEPLRDLTCAFVASLALSANSEKELLRLCGLDHPLSETELEPLYDQYPFLRSGAVDGTA